MHSYQALELDYEPSAVFLSLADFLSLKIKYTKHILEKKKEKEVFTHRLEITVVSFRSFFLSVLFPCLFKETIKAKS